METEQLCLYCNGENSRRPCGCVPPPADLDNLHALCRDEYSGEFGLPIEYVFPLLYELKQQRARPFPTGIWCPRCEQTQPLDADEPRDDAGKKWSDLCCGVCHYIVATVKYGGENGD